MSGFHLVTKNWGGSTVKEWAYLARQVPWDVLLGVILQVVWAVFNQKQMVVV